jgi:anti-sigma regulatory factor (Ser/Thr protein kinase)
MAHDRQGHAPSMSRRTVRLPENTSAPRVAREALDTWLPDVAPGVRRDARSIVSELVANAVRYGSPPIELCVERRGARVRIEVADAGEPCGRRPPGDWSQRIIEGLACCGVQGDDAHVWFELSVRAPGIRNEFET